jgi:hypothetical protein
MALEDKMALIDQMETALDPEAMLTCRYCGREERAGSFGYVFDADNSKEVKDMMCERCARVRRMVIEKART